MPWPSPSADHRPYGARLHPPGSPATLFSREEEAMDFWAGTEPRVAGADQSLYTQSLKTSGSKWETFWDSLPDFFEVEAQENAFPTLILLPYCSRHKENLDNSG